jgi:glycosyltransferase involved in cell wall biosynthesis
LPTFNRAKLLKKSVESVFNQTFQEWEILVIDNGSTDETDEIMNALCKKDNRIKYLKVSESRVPGITEYLNIGIKSSRGKYIARLDDDDIWCFDDKLKQQVDFLDMNPDYVLVGGGVKMVDSIDKVLYKYFKREKDNDIRKRALLSCPFAHPTIMFRKETAIAVGGYDDYVCAEDWGFYLKLGKIGKLYNFQVYYLNYLVSDMNSSFSNKNNRQTLIAKLSLIVIKKYRKDYPHYYFGFLLNYSQYIYSFFPYIFKIKIQYFLRYLKRKYF